jgi:glycerol 2-dehydrogenase (NADP+)
VTTLSHLICSATIGTWKSPPGAVEQAVEFALTDGYKHIDTAAAYSNEAEVGIGIKASGVKREDFFLTTKLQETDFADPEAALESSLNKLGTDYLDLCTFFMLFSLAQS